MAAIFIKRSVIMVLQKRCHLNLYHHYQPIKLKWFTSGSNKGQKTIEPMKNILIIAGLISLFSSCYYDNVDELHPQITPCDTTGVVSFANDIQPIMLHNCGSENPACHQGDASQSGYGLENYNAVISTINNSGVFLETITHDPSISTSKWMPQNSTAKLNDCSIQQIEAWMNRGTPNN